ncbi:DNA binding 1 domain containing protein [Asbolus verrucosus]|uniref:Methylated-DNA--protein-cysteine methyltransferase n=1 Tax=Asbolus verrucosus TaxID=1661398 RepID=A0A482VDK7_ASBVE|nr:DNA binding 1 domain containing protein [Asbolus verrucosus]
MSTSNLIKVTKISPREYKKLPALMLNYGTAPTRFGNCLTAFKNDTLCYLSFYDKEPPLEDLKKTWANATLTENEALIARNVAKLFESDDNVEIYLKGTDFEMEVWEALLKLKKGTTASYEDVAKAVGRPRAVRAVGRAVGKNNVAYFVPCHRVISKDGSVHKYRSGAHRKLKMLKEEGAI